MVGLFHGKSCKIDDLGVPLFQETTNLVGVMHLLWHPLARAGLTSGFRTSKRCLFWGRLWVVGPGPKIEPGIILRIGCSTLDDVQHYQLSNSSKNQYTMLH